MKFEIIVFVFFLCLHRLKATVEEHDNEDVQTQRENIISEKNNSIAQECHQFNNDYREYIKCLKREKRQYYDGHFAHGIDKRACFDECLEAKCDTSSCLHDCHARCKKRLIETYSKTIETSLDCDGDSCHKINQQLPNITLNINLTNILPNVTRNCVNNPTEDKNCIDKGKVEGKVVNITNVINNVNPGSNCPYPGCNFYPYAPPQLPQITIDFNSRQTGGCLYPWMCIQRPQIGPNDCSMCAYPFLRQQCDPSCFSDQQRNTASSIQKRNSQPFSTNHYRNY